MYLVGSSAYLQGGRLPQPRRLAQQTAAKEPELPHAHIALLLTAVREQDHAEAVRLLEILADKFKVKLPGLASDPDASVFLKSAEYKASAKRRKRK